MPSGPFRADMSGARSGSAKETTWASACEMHLQAFCDGSHAGVVTLSRRAYSRCPHAVLIATAPDHRLRMATAYRSSTTAASHSRRILLWKGCSS